MERYFSILQECDDLIKYMMMAYIKKPHAGLFLQIHSIMHIMIDVHQKLFAKEITDDGIETLLFTHKTLLQFKNVTVEKELMKEWE